jgi:hypothetical protein
MTHRIVNTARSLALLGAVSLGLRQVRASVREPEARRSVAGTGDHGDAWLFDRPQTAVSSEAYMLDQEYGRVSGALAGLRAVLSSLTKMPLAAEPAYMPMAAASVDFDPALFDEIAAPVPVLTNVVAFDEDDLFIETSATLQKPSAIMDSLSRVA